VFVPGLPLALSAWRRAGLAAGLALALLGPSLVEAKGPPAESETVRLADLPREAQITDSLIRSNGPFPYRKDGMTFGNRERLLPAKPRGHYREYTVRTPSSRDRGARRIVCGGNPPSKPESCFYTDDHYASFKRIVQ
jgi:ribonuclease T1